MYITDPDRYHECAGLLYLAMLVVAIMVVGGPHGQLPPGLDTVFRVTLAIALVAAGAAVVLRLTAAVLTLRWHKRL